MPKTWSTGQAKKFARELKFNTPYYFVYNIAQNIAPYEDAQLYSEVVFTRHAPFTGNPMTADGTSAVQLCQVYGPIHEQPPAGMRNVATPGPQVGSPLGDNYEGFLDEAELRGLEKLAARTSSPRARRSPSSWRA
jgi:hypothetical protein